MLIHNPLEEGKQKDGHIPWLWFHLASSYESWVLQLPVALLAAASETNREFQDDRSSLSDSPSVAASVAFEER
jgi:hypothetical protein